MDAGRVLEETNPPPATAALAGAPDVTGLKQPNKPTKPSNEESLLEARAKFIKTIQDKVNQPTIKEVKAELTTHAFWHKLVRLFANKRESLTRIRDSLERQNELITIGPNKNDFDGEMSRAAAMAENYDMQYNDTLRLNLQKIIGTYAKQAKISAEQAMANLHFYFEALHEPERRMVKYLLNVPLSKENILKVGDGYTSPENYRAAVLDFLNEYKEPNETLRHKMVEELRTKLEEVVSDKNNLDDKLVKNY